MGRPDTVRMRADRRDPGPGARRRQRASRCPRRRARGAARPRQRAFGESAACDGARPPELLRSLRARRVDAAQGLPEEPRAAARSERAVHRPRRLVARAPARDRGRGQSALRGLAAEIPVARQPSRLARAKARELHVDNEVNPGLGLRYRVPHGERLDWIFDTGLYRDSGRNRAFIAGAGASWHATEHLRLAGALTFFKSDTYNRGRAGIAPLPLVAWDTRAATFNLVYFPKVREINSVATVGFWLTLW